MSLEEILRAATSRAEVIRVRNVLNPVLWGCAVATPVCGGLAYLLGSDPVLRYGFATLSAVLILSLPVGYIYFILRDPDRLQSEEFANRKQELLLLARKARSPVPARPELPGARVEEDEL